MNIEEIFIFISCKCEKMFIKISTLIKEKKELPIIDYSINEMVEKINKSENRRLIKQKYGSFREETDEEFKNRLFNKYSEKEEKCL